MANNSADLVDRMKLCDPHDTDDVVKHLNAAAAEVQRLREAICLYVQSKKDGLGRNALDWWRLQEIEKESAHTREPSHT